MALSFTPYVHSPGLRRASAAPYVSAAASYLDGTGGTGLGAGYGSGFPGYGSTPPTAPAKPSGSGGGVDYAALLANDAILGQANTNIAAQTTANQASLTAARRAALANFGEVPASFGSGAGNVGADIDQTTRDLAAQATSGGVSTVARLRKAYDQAQQGDVANVAARGLLRSGATGQHLSEDLSNFNVAGYDARQKLLDYMNGLWQGFQQQQQALQQQGLSAKNDALLRIIEQIKAGLLGGGGGARSLTAPSADFNAVDLPDYYGPLRNLSAADWQTIGQLPVNRKAASSLALPQAVPA